MLGFCVLFVIWGLVIGFWGLVVLVCGLVVVLYEFWAGEKELVVC